MSRTEISLRWFSDEASYWADKLYVDINLTPLIPQEDENFGLFHFGSIKIWRHVQV